MASRLRCGPAAARAVCRMPLVPRRTLFFRRRPRYTGPGDTLNFNRMTKEAEDYRRNRMSFLLAGTVAGIISLIYMGNKLRHALREEEERKMVQREARREAARLKRALKADSALAPTDPNAAVGRKVVVRDEDGREVVPTGNKTVPTFPRTIQLPTEYTDGTTVQASPATAAAAAAAATAAAAGAAPPPGPPSPLAPPTTEYTLVGVGVRTVSFIGIQVYLVGYYVATADVAALQLALVRSVNPIATTLVPGERDQLRAALLDPAEGERLWDSLLARQRVPARSAFRVIPVRDTDFGHLRDGFVRSVKKRAPPADAADRGFGEAVRRFGAIFNRGSVPKQKELLLVRDARGRLVVAYDDCGKTRGADGKPVGKQVLGVVEDERLSRALWLNYLAGKSVASEPARQSIVQGIMEFVERPAGTVAAQVV